MGLRAKHCNHDTNGPEYWPRMTSGAKRYIYAEAPSASGCQDVIGSFVHMHDVVRVSPSDIQNQTFNIEAVN